MWSAERGSFFSLARSFSFPGMTTYSVSKSFSTSTPRLLLGRSFTWPKEASTVNPLPRYFWIVFALAGDSTMTRPLDNVSSIWRSLDLKLARILAAAQNGGPGPSALSYQLSAVSPHLSHQRRQHSFHLNNLCFKTLIGGIAQVVQVVSEQKLIFEFACGPNCDL